MNTAVQKLGDLIETTLKARTLGPGFGITAHQLARYIWEETLTDPTEAVLDDIREERRRQDVKWGQQNHPDGTGPDVGLRGIFTRPQAEIVTLIRDQVDHNTQRGESSWLLILLEEVMEAITEPIPANLRGELVQVAAVATEWIEAIDRRSK